MKKYILILSLMIINFLAAFGVSAQVTYDVTFDANGGTPEPDPQVVEEGELVTEPTEPTRDGYVFVGWLHLDPNTLLIVDPMDPFWDFDNDTVEDDMLLAAEWTPVYEVSFNAQGGAPTPDTQELEEGELVTEPADPSRTGYDFLGWFTSSSGGDLWDFDNDTVGDEDMTLYAQWEIIIYTVTVDYENGTIIGIGDGFFTYGETVELTAVPNWFYELEGWTGFIVSQDETITFDMPDHDVNLTATFVETEGEPIDEKISTYLSDINMGDFGGTMIAAGFIIFISIAFGLLGAPGVVILLIDIVLILLGVALGLIPAWVVLIMVMIIFALGVIYSKGGATSA